MPKKSLKALAEKAGKSTKEADRYWEETVEELKGSTSGTLTFPSNPKNWGDRHWSYVMQIVKKRLGLGDSLEDKECTCKFDRFTHERDWKGCLKHDPNLFEVVDAKKKKKKVLSPEVQKLAEELKNDDVYETYYYRFGKYIRKGLKSVSIKHTTEAIQFFNGLKLDLDKVTSTHKEIKGDVNKVKEYIDEVIKACISNDGVITSDEFDYFFYILYGIYEGIQNYAGKNLTKDEWIFLANFGGKTAKKTFRDSVLAGNSKYAVLKGLFSLGTHYAIEGEHLEKSIKEQTTSGDVEQTSVPFGKKIKRCICLACGHEQERNNQECSICPKCEHVMVSKVSEHKLLQILNKQIRGVLGVIREFNKTGDKSVISRLIF